MSTEFRRVLTHRALLASLPKPLRVLAFGNDPSRKIGHAK